MSEINTNNSVLNDYSVRNTANNNAQSNELGQKAFLELMITQLENQDPLSPQDNGEFIAQLAQFSSVESLDRLNNNFDSFTNNFVANQALQASTLVGRSVTVPTTQTELKPGGVVSGVFDLPSSSGRVNIDIKNANGVLVDQIDLGSRPSGEMLMRWNGKNIEINGETIPWQSSAVDGQPPGVYHFNVSASLDGKTTQLDTSLSANVNSVTVGANGALTLNLAGVGAISLSDVKQFNE